MYPQGGGQAPQGRPQEPWQSSGGHYGSHSPAQGSPEPEPTRPGRVYGSAQPPDPYQQASEPYRQQHASDPYQQQHASDPYRQQAAGYPQGDHPQRPPASYPQQTPPPAGFGPTPVAPPPKKGNKALLIVGLVVGGLVLCCGGGAALVAVFGDDISTPDAVATAGPSEDEELDGDLDDYRTGDCLTISASDDIKEASCGTAGAYKVVLRKDGTISESACKDSDYTEYLYQEGLLGASDGIVLCIAPAKS